MWTLIGLLIIISINNALVIISPNAENTDNQLNKLSKVNENTFISKSSKTLKKSDKFGVKFDETDDDNCDDYMDENENRCLPRNRKIRFNSEADISYAWGRWEKWSKCNKTCVQIKRRPCVKYIQSNNDSVAVEVPFYPDPSQVRIGCHGVMRKYRACNDEICKKSTQYFRDEEYQELEKIPYKGKFYFWRGYEKEHNECELFCKATDSDVFVSMNKSVMDGTPCEKPSIYYTHGYRRRALCVEGICRVRYGGIV